MRELKHIRQSKGLTQSQFADAIGVCQQLVSRYENGLNYPSLPVAAKICTVLDCSLLDLFGVQSYAEVV